LLMLLARYIYIYVYIYTYIYIYVSICQHTSCIRPACSCCLRASSAFCVSIRTFVSTFVPVTQVIWVDLLYLLMLRLL
jgi:hypothetical protein